MNNLHVKKGDTVMINSGADKGKKGKVLQVLPKDNKIVVEGVNVRTKVDVKKDGTKVRVCAKCGEEIK